MKRNGMRRIFTVVLTLALVLSLGMFGYHMYQYWQAEQAYKEAEDLVQLPEPEGTPEPSVPTETPVESVVPSETPEPTPTYVDPYADALNNMDFVALRERNEDVLGWIMIPDTRVSYPLVQGEDNDYYINHTWRKNYNSVGAIFVEWQCSPDLSDFNTIIYGHRVNNKSMFGALLNYKKQSYLDEHPYVYITDDNGTHTYQIFAAHEVELSSPVYWLGADREVERQAYIDFALERSVVDGKITPESDDLFLTLSTCTGSGHDTRWVVQAVKVIEESEEEPQASQLPEASPSAEAPADTQIQPETTTQPPEITNTPETVQPESIPVETPAEGTESIASSSETVGLLLPEEAEQSAGPTQTQQTT